jgi:anti-sigma factor RsiW
MTMDTASHPDDERLAAYAGGDADALSDGELIAHLSTCDRCRPLVDELTLLRSALASLPDLAPSRPLRLIPPVAEPAPRAGALGWLRRLTAPAMAAGVGLVLVGAIGLGASGGMLFGQAASGPMIDSAASERELVPAAGGAPSLAPGDTTGSAAYGSGAPRSLSSSSPPAPSASSDDGGRTSEVEAADQPSPEQPWLTLLIAGVAIFGTSTVLRFALPRAG